MALKKKEPFQAVHDRLIHEVRQTAKSQRVPGMDSDDVESEMLLCLWRAYQTHDKHTNITLEQYWWAVWMNKKADLIAFWLRQKRDVRKEITVGNDWFWKQEDMDDLKDLWPCHDPADFLVPPAPTGDALVGRVWTMLALGYSRQEILTRCEISKRKFYSVINSLKHPTIKENLTCLGT